MFKVVFVQILESSHVHFFEQLEKDLDQNDMLIGSFKGQSHTIVRLTTDKERNKEKKMGEIREGEGRKREREREREVVLD